MSNVSIFRNHLNKENLYMEELNDDNGGVFFRTRQSLEAGGDVLLVVSFNEKQDIVDLNIYNIANITNPLKKDSLHQLINELNVDYRFTKFTEFEGKVAAQYSYNIIPDQLDAGYLLDMLIMLLRTTEDSYSKFMKLQWA